MSNPKVFFDITAGGSPLGRIIMELHADIVPKTAGNYLKKIFFHSFKLNYPC